MTKRVRVTERIFQGHPQRIYTGTITGTDINDVIFLAQAAWKTHFNLPNHPATEITVTILD